MILDYPDKPGNDIVVPVNDFAALNNAFVATGDDITALCNDVVTLSNAFV